VKQLLIYGLSKDWKRDAQIIGVIWFGHFMIVFMLVNLTKEFTLLARLFVGKWLVTPGNSILAGGQGDYE